MNLDEIENRIDETDTILELFIDACVSRERSPSTRL
jgi:hypothetical protein